MTDARFVVSGEKAQLPNGRVIVSGTRTSNGGRDKKHVFIEIECKQDDADTVQKALAVILQQHGRIDASIEQRHDLRTVLIDQGRGQQSIGLIAHGRCMAALRSCCRRIGNDCSIMPAGRGRDGPSP